MHYTEYCKARGIHQASPFATYDFYKKLHQIAISRSAALADIEQMSIKKLSKLYEFVQRCLDILLSCMGTFIGVIPSLVIAIAIKIDSPGPVFYRQTRVGKSGKIFQMIKFRTMCHNAESMTGPVWTATQDARLTRVGPFLRKARLDELPQLFNILKGEMTFVGPRPERPEFVYWFIRYLPAFDRRHVRFGPERLRFLKLLRSAYDISP